MHHAGLCVCCVSFERDGWSGRSNKKQAAYRTTKAGRFNCRVFKAACRSAEAAAQREIINALKSGVIGNTMGYSKYMQAFARQVVNGLWLTGFSVEADGVQMSISGGALSPELVPGYILRLNNENIMRGKTFASLQMQLPKEESGKTSNRQQYLEFELKSVVKSEADKR
jgi:hypothetical protein